MNKLFKTKYTMKISFLLLASGIICFSSCTKKFDDENTDKTKLSSVSKTEYPFMFSYALMAPTLSPDNFEVGEGTIAGVYSQFYSQAAQSFPTDRYVIVQAWDPAIWNPVYTQAVPQLKTIMEGSDAASAETAIAKIWWVWCFHRLTDHFGPIPYFDAGNAQRSVQYTPQDSIYFDFFKKLDEAATALKSHTGEKPFGAYDLVYGKTASPVNNWIKFANTLRLRLALRISGVNPTLAKTEAEAAVAGGVMTDLADDAYMPKNTSYYNEYNGLAVTAGWDDIRMSATMESILKGYSDPRLPIFFQPSVATSTYEGVRNGLFTSEKIIDINSRLFNSNLGTRWCNWVNGDWKTNYGVPQDIMHCAEAYFLKAEGALNGWNMGGGSAQELYETGIRKSMAQWGVTDAAAIDAYVANTATPIAPQDGQNSPAVNDYPVKWSDNTTMQRKQLAQQKWLALFPDGMEGWAEVRRTNLPALYPVVHSENSDLPQGTFIKRIPFLDIESLTNGDAVTKAVQMLGGPDNTATRLWWDKD
ncbi:SusD/RagB family nutrient-binding outer membrane lipoprotein [Ferruginibacter paludis]|uniref:SusD/RagB family nutrient-binding outer membrane lipoprotein n=1 Tax=Ferruginibacter paludis TaxID=1310417 RepID=UPI0025B3D476|nr:SusD/RagB family nutrient-binding outer membrane lipoprotein [Ferruginibacter paludis]MDN3656804.1 SusD/RagB family nutrient-binding outer membrane lipoprotein [Ferruginibacter paludis]